MEADRLEKGSRGQADPTDSFMSSPDQTEPSTGPASVSPPSDSSVSAQPALPSTHDEDGELAGEEAGRERRRSPYLGRAPRLPPGETLDPRLIFEPAAREVELEVGPGRGSFMFERALAQPAVALLGFEVRLKWATLVDERLRRDGLGGRCRVFAEDVRAALPRLAAGSLSRIFVHFPDPWWKKRHSKRRLSSEPLVQQFLRLLRSGGELFVQSDVQACVEGYRSVLDPAEGLQAWGDQPGSATLKENPYEARSPREHRAIADGLPVYRLRYRRT